MFFGIQAKRSAKNFLLYGALLSTLFLPFQKVIAAFDPNYIISDQDATNWRTMTTEDIQKFLEAKKGSLANYTTVDLDGETKSAAEIIYNAALKNQINPQFLLTMLQKEQSLVENANPIQSQYDWATGYGVCDSCDVGDSKVTKFKGFTKQVYNTAEFIRSGFNDPNQSWVLYKPGMVRTVSGQTITPVTLATGLLYSYTPHLLGNENFWNIWNRWFTRIFPNGSLVQVLGEPGVWLIQNNLIRAFTTKAALTSRYDPKLIIPISKTDLARYAEGPAIRLSNYSVIRDPKGLVYLLIDDVKQYLAGKETLRVLGYHPDEIIDVTEEEAASYPDGNIITKESIYPTGMLLKDTETKTLYYVENGRRYTLVSEQVAKVNYPKITIRKAKRQSIAEYPLYGTKGFKDGTLVGVDGAPQIYVISDGVRRLIPSEEVFHTIGWKFENILWTDEQTLLAHPEGPPVLLTPPSISVALP